MPRASSRARFGAAAIVLPLLACSPSSPAPGTATPTGTAPAITAADLRARLAIFADDSMMGRAAGTLGNVRGTAYLAGEARRLGLTPAGENGTFFQTVPLVARTL
ncbi:MAG: peptidase M28, partial [Gemmatimonadales bacterium]|nr:peptidase M28 [Gemmatimonadales bacterium]